MSLFVNCAPLSGFLPNLFVTFVVSEYHPKVPSFWTETFVNTRLSIILKNGFQQMNTDNTSEFSRFHCVLNGYIVVNQGNLETDYCISMA